MRLMLVIWFLLIVNIALQLPEETTSKENMGHPRKEL